MTTSHLQRLSNWVFRLLRQRYPRLERIEQPGWLDGTKWRPAFCAQLTSGRILVVDLIPSGHISKAIYDGEVVPLMEEQPEIRVLVCVNEETLDQAAEAFCRERGIGLVTMALDFGLESIVPTDLDPAAPPTVAHEAGWFPQAIMDHVPRLKNISFRAELAAFAKELPLLGNDLPKVTGLVRSTIDLLLKSYPGCRPTSRRFMRLQNFEQLFKTTDHVLHSFRVFLAGCVVLDFFYRECTAAHRRFRLARGQSSFIEYCWLLASVFHDIGKPFEVGGKMLQSEIGDDDGGYIVKTEMSKQRWRLDKYFDARRLLSSLGVFAAGAGAHPRAIWDAGAITSPKANTLGTAWTVLYTKCRSHAVLSALDMFAEIIEQASADDRVANRPIVVTYAAPAALAILLHDWKIWPQAAGWGLFPVDAGVMPLAALLIYLV